MCNLPPLKISTDWSANVTALRQEVEKPDADTHIADLCSKLTSILDGVQIAIDSARGESTDLAAIDIAARLILPALMWTLEES